MVERPQPPTRRKWGEQRQQEEQQILARLPEIDEREFVLTWELEACGDVGRDEGRCWVIKHGDRVLYREPAHYEDYHRYELLARVLREKYGERIKDLAPVEGNDSSYYLYGDYLGAVTRVEAARRRNFRR